MPNMHIGVAGVARKIKTPNIGVNGVARNVKTGYIGVNGVARKFYNGGKSLSDYQEGSIIYIPENGVNTEFLIAKHNYESGLNGSGRTLLARHWMYESKPQWSNSSSKKTYGQSHIDTWLNDTYALLLPEKVRTMAGQTTFYVAALNTSVTTLSRTIFIPSADELGTEVSDRTWLTREGSRLPVYKQWKYYSYINSSYYSVWTRSTNQYGSATRVWKMKGYTAEDTSYGSATANSPCHPMFTLPSSTSINPESNIIIL